MAMKKQSRSCRLGAIIHMCLELHGFYTELWRNNTFQLKKTKSQKIIMENDEENQPMHSL